MESLDNQRGLALALSSSAFIGASFIIKKKGLIRARGSGRGASAGGFAYLRESMWWIGLITMILGEVANFAAYAFAPAILVTPLGALSVIVSAVLASFVLKERLTVGGKMGCMLCILGSTIIVLNAPTEQAIDSVDQIADMIVINPAFQFYVVLVLLACAGLIYYFAPLFGKENVLVYVAICSLIGSISVIGCKALGIAIKLSLSGSNQMSKPATWAFAAVVGVSVVTQMNYLNKALDTFNTAIVTPIYYVFFTTCTIAASALLFNGWDDETPAMPVAVSHAHASCASFTMARFITVLCGFATIVAGVGTLHYTREPGPHDAATTKGADATSVSGETELV